MIVPEAIFELISSVRDITPKSAIQTSDGTNNGEINIPGAINDGYSNAELSSSHGLLSKFSLDSNDLYTKSKSATESSSDDYSKTNIQVENVDEADITKTDGKYIYSISGNKVIITDATDASNVHIVSTITTTSSGAPEDLLIYKDKLVAISEDTINTSTSSNYYSNKYSNKTVIQIYNIADRENPKMVKSYMLNQPYYTSRCIDNRLIVISSGRIRKDRKTEKKIGDYEYIFDRTYEEDNKTKELAFNNYKYFKNEIPSNETLISQVDLDNAKKDIKLSSYLIDINNAYVSTNSIYLAKTGSEYKYYSNSKTNKFNKLRMLFGVNGIYKVNDYGSYYENKTYLYKFDINNETIDYVAHTDVEGKIINQYSMDEKDGHLRCALYDNYGSRVVIFDNMLHKIGQSDNVAKGENMKSSRFIGDKVYMVTYKTIDPLYVIDLSNERNPMVLGELKIPGYSTYLHPYDDTHIIGIGMQTKETVNKNSDGKVVSTTAKITGMKMALFDVSDVTNPKQISQTIIGDARTTSSILTNPKALLFSKEKQLIAIPVNFYSSNFSIESSSTDNNEIEKLYKSKSKEYVGEGYVVYNINLEDGFKLKGIIKHDQKKNNSKTYYYTNYNNSIFLRGLYIKDNLFTVSENEIKVNKLENLETISDIKIRDEIKKVKSITVNSINVVNEDEDDDSNTMANTVSNTTLKNDVLVDENLIIQIQ